MSDDHTALPQPAETADRLLILLDESPSGRHTAAIGVAMAAAMGAEAIFHVAIPIEHLDAASPSELAAAASAHQTECHARTEPLFDAVRELAAAGRVVCETILTIDEAPGDAVRRVASERQCLLIVVGSRERGTLSRVLRGSLVDDLLQVSTCPVLVCRDDMAFGSIQALA